MGINFREEAPLISSDLRNLVAAAYWLAHQGVFLDFGFSILKYIASIVAIFLFILDYCTPTNNWMTTTTTSFATPLILYIFFSLPSWIFGIIRGELGQWIALIVVVYRFFLPKRFPDSLKWPHDQKKSLKLPAALILLIVVAPDLFADTLRNSVVGVVICFIIACVLLECITEPNGCLREYYRLEKVGINLMLVYPIWTLVLYVVGALFFVVRGLIGY